MVMQVLLTQVVVTKLQVVVVQAVLDKLHPLQIMEDTAVLVFKLILTEITIIGVAVAVVVLGKIRQVLVE